MFGNFLAPLCTWTRLAITYMECRCIYLRQKFDRTQAKAEGWPPTGTQRQPLTCGQAGIVQKDIGSMCDVHSTLSPQPWVLSRLSFFPPSFLCHLLRHPPMIGIAAQFIRSAASVVSPLYTHSEVTSLSRTGLQRMGLGQLATRRTASIAVAPTEAS